MTPECLLHAASAEIDVITREISAQMGLGITPQEGIAFLIGEVAKLRVRVADLEARSPETRA